MGSLLRFVRLRRAFARRRRAARAWVLREPVLVCGAGDGLGREVAFGREPGAVGGADGMGCCQVLLGAR